MLVKGAPTPLELCDDRGLSVSFGGSAGSQGMVPTALQQHKEGCQMLSKARSSTHSCLEWSSSCWGGYFSTSSNSHWWWVWAGEVAEGLAGLSSDISHWVIGIHFPYGMFQMDQGGSISWLTPHHTLTTLMYLLRMRQLPKAEKSLYIFGVLDRC